MPYVVGLTGGIGSGKSAAGRLFESRGACVVDADAVSRALTAPGGAAIEPIRQAFGAQAITAEGALDRAQMRRLVFADPAARARLEAILHPLIGLECERRIRGGAGTYVIFMVPLLVESGHPRERVHRILVVDCSEPVQLERVIRRDRLARDEVLRIIAAQATRAQRLAAADDVIDNDGDEAALAPQVEALDLRYRAIAAGRAWPWPPQEQPDA